MVFMLLFCNVILSWRCNILLHSFSVLAFILNGYFGLFLVRYFLCLLTCSGPYRCPAPRTSGTVWTRSTAAACERCCCSSCCRPFAAERWGQRSGPDPSSCWRTAACPRWVLQEEQRQRRLSGPVRMAEPRPTWELDPLVFPLQVLSDQNLLQLGPVCLQPLLQPLRKLHGVARLWRHNSNQFNSRTGQNQNQSKKQEPQPAELLLFYLKFHQETVLVAKKSKKKTKKSNIL